MKARRNVITAGPSAGKSSTIRELSARGYRTLPEAARIVFDQKISEGVDPETVRAKPNFHSIVENTDRWIEANAPHTAVWFSDRSLADNIAYRRHFGNDVPIELIEECEARYDNVFVLERIDFEDDAVRDEDETEAEAVHQEIIETYTDLGYDIEIVPVDPVDVRADTIEAAVEHPAPIH